MEHVHGFTDTCPDALSGPSSQLFLTLLQALITSRCDFKTEYPPDYGSQLADGDEFDFIVVGGGSAGSIVASRLSEVSQWKVLLLEAGTYPSMTTKVPMLFAQLRGTEEDWNYEMEPSSTCCLSFKNRKCLYPRGKVLGGSSSINAILYARSIKQDHDEWVNAGNTNWDHESVTKHYDIIEKQLNLTTSSSDSAIASTLIKTFQELGYNEYTNENLMGYGNRRLTIGKDGVRMNAAKAFLVDINHRTNLVMALNAHVSKITLDQNNRATGVEVMINNRLIHVKTKKEIILSAGSISSPQILMRSGIGPEEHLNALKIPVKSNLRVGENLQDHVILLGVGFNVNIPPASGNFLDGVYNYFMHRTGPLVKPDLFGFSLFTNSKNNSAYPNLDIYPLVHEQNNPVLVESICKSLISPPDMTKFYVENNKKSSTIMFFLKVLTTKSRGKIMLRSNDPMDRPAIYPNFFSDANDIELMLDAIKIVKSFAKTKAFSKLRPELLKLPVENCKHEEFDSDDYWRCVIKNIGHHLHHPIGTCKMGPKSDPNAVVDPNLKVYGVDGLRVVDASVIPVIPKVGTNAPTMMIGNKAAEIIKERWINTRDEL